MLYNDNLKIMRDGKNDIKLNNPYHVTSPPTERKQVVRTKKNDEKPIPEICKDGFCKYIDPDDGDEIDFLVEKGYQTMSLKYLAEAIASDDKDNASPDLDDPSEWPRTYKIKSSQGWQNVKVDMEYNPDFSGRILV